MKDLDNILERYFEGETSLKEEEALRQYFSQGNIDAKYQHYAPLFGFFTEEREALAAVTPEKKKVRRLPHHIWSGIAAGILFVTGVWTIYSIQKENNSRSMVYINGEKISNEQIINSQALISLQNISEIDEDILSSQIDILESFTE